MAERGEKPPVFAEQLLVIIELLIVVAKHGALHGQSLSCVRWVHSGRIVLSESVQAGPSRGTHESLDSVL